ncbi:MAG: 50S ribosomal protein L32 [Candidatus Latescibacteria bacterium]|jgi:large subunit ribosomal protein L32|nr:50S ribosomal protein L32 [Candidatus Latescibacterota bacterium]
MVAVPKRRISRTRRDKRRTHWKMKAPAVSACAHCGQPARPHRVCTHCGQYRGREYAAPQT